MFWETIFDGEVLGDHITVEWYVDDEENGDYPVRVKATNKNPPVLIQPIIGPCQVIFSPPPGNPSSEYTFDYDSIDEMYERFARETGRDATFNDELEKAIQNRP
ncbi:hypothetical protein [Dickeya dadantii]|uniref:hypothetical protein n=1 Tax=Dickeya dadantii TaxID=204038 RepID=UPI0021D9B042|nr:hypothetical protein [Dickeya dadantii]